MTRKLFNIRDSVLYFRAGSTPEGKQILIGSSGLEGVCIEFDAAGMLVNTVIRRFAENAAPEDLERWMYEIGAIPSTIQVQQFHLPDRSIGIQELPDYLAEFANSPLSFPADRQLHLTQRLKEWKDSESFVLIWDEDYELDKNGEVEST